MTRAKSLWPDKWVSKTAALTGSFQPAVKSRQQSGGGGGGGALVHAWTNRELGNENCPVWSKQKEELLWHNISKIVMMVMECVEVSPHTVNHTQVCVGLRSCRSVSTSTLVLMFWLISTASRTYKPVDGI